MALIHCQGKAPLLPGCRAMKASTYSHSRTHQLGSSLLTNAWKTRCLDWGGGFVFNLGLFGALSSASVRDQSRANPSSLTFPCLLPSVCRSTASEHWLSWSPAQCVAVAAETKGSQAHHLTPQWVQQHLANERWEIVFHLFVPHFFPLSQLCHCRTKKNALGEKKRLWIFPWSVWGLAGDSQLFMPLPFFLFWLVTLLMYIV